MLGVESIKNKLNPVFSNYNINSAILFGSYAKGTSTEKSDIDLMVDSKLRGLSFFALIEDIREALDQKEVDVFDVTHIDSGSKVQEEITSTGVKIYG
ncbi:nucleotidyltransferase domain-containing protein [Treponema sp.]|uniref:nucleotidyltransferase family protein n=1 Tax=Treponema sp. TaxID=166 RepID=UPI00298E28A7|nr:nucleotidyltransferase domain-containing protein [Treponema sp.]MCR5613129.1 nucleotidyltransferase domain-containing protein [Treponema sp.]